MPGFVQSADQVCDVLVAGCGLAGVTAAIAFAREGFSVVACGAEERAAPGRTVALLDRSIAYLERLRLWGAIEPKAAPMLGLRLVDDTGGLFPARPVEFRSSEIGLGAFGWNVENDRMAEALTEQAAATPGIERILSAVTEYDFSGARATARLADGRQIVASLVVGADGRGSLARRAAGLATRIKRYPQTALTVLLSHRLPHGGFSTEFHTPSGPFTLVPLPPAATPNRSSLVWLMTDEEAERRGRLADADLAREIERQAHSILGDMRLEGGRGMTPMMRQVTPRIAGERLALVGDAAHAFPPIGAQGLNLGLRDVEALAAAAAEARATGRDIGSATALALYERARRADIFTRTMAVDGLNRSLLAHFAPLDFARGMGLAALGSIAPLRRFVMREGVAPRMLEADG